MFLDERGSLLVSLAGRSRASCGQTPVLDQIGPRQKKASAIAALCDQVRLYFHSYLGRNVDSPRVMAFLRAVSRELGTSWCLIWDKLNAHCAETNILPLRTFFLLSYAPKLNPVAYLWTRSKMNSSFYCANQEVDWPNCPATLAAHPKP